VALPALSLQEREGEDKRDDSSCTRDSPRGTGKGGKKEEALCPPLPTAERSPERYSPRAALLNTGGEKGGEKGKKKKNYQSAPAATPTI